eukprot:m.356136 g.356136  ORF g.356136 m.356136 type:complete len:1427 (-) comp17449_c0_seq1:155-4435(-)
MAAAAPVTDLNFRVPLTTREPREGETNGVHYHFVTKDEFERLMDADAFRETGQNKGNWYGTLKQSASTFSQIPAKSKPKASRYQMQNVVIKRNAAGRFGLMLAGGVTQGQMISILKMDNVVELTNTVQPLALGDLVLAINGVSVAGAATATAEELLKSAPSTAELLILCMCRNKPVLQMIEDFLAEAPDEGHLVDIKHDIRQDIYQAGEAPYTTREPREGEVDGKNYNFVTREKFDELLASGYFAEAGEKDGVFYGQPVPKNQPTAKKSLRRSASHRKSGVKHLSAVTVHELRSKSNFQSLGLDLTETPEGIFITHVTPNLAADKAGLVPGQQVVAVDGVTVSGGKSVRDVREKLDEITEVHEIQARFNSDAFIAAMKPQSEDVFTVIIQKNSANSFGIHIQGGLESNRLVSIASVGDVVYVNADHREILPGDSLLALDGVNTAGAALDDVLAMFRASGDDLELTLLSASNSTASENLKDFFFASESDSEALKAAKSDVRSKIYGSATPYTTRPKREGEVDGERYNFISEQEFARKQAAGDFLEWGESNGFYYGTAAPPAVGASSFRRTNLSRASRVSRKAGRVQTVVVSRNSSDEFGIKLKGGRTDGCLPFIKELKDCKQVIATRRPLMVGDAVVAVDGMSTAGIDASQAEHILNDTLKHDVELTVLCPSEPGPIPIRRFLDLDVSTADEETATLIHDIQRDIYATTVPFTTRAPRAGEQNGVHYNFVSEEQFDKLVESGHFVETGESNGVKYGTPLVGRRAFEPRSSFARHSFARRSFRMRQKLISITRDDPSASCGMSLSEGTNGVFLVKHVVPGTPSHNAGVRQHMRIEKINGEPTTGMVLDECMQKFQGAANIQLHVSYDPTQVQFEPRGKKVSASYSARQCKRVNLWCTPRSLSTALLYSFAQRADVTAVDEPFYAHYLAKNPQLNHPGRDEVLASQSSDASTVVSDVIGGDYATDVVVFKQITKHLTDSVDRSWIKGCTNIMIVRNPASQIASWSETLAPTLEELGWTSALSIFSQLRAEGVPVSVVDADELAANPQAVLQQLCFEIGLPFDDSMLSWNASAGMPFDGVWGKYWYKGVHQSTGFQAAARDAVVGEYMSIVEDAYPIYDAISRHSIMINAQAIALPDERNRSVIMSVGGKLMPRAYAKVSVFDSAVQGGDAVWEGIRLYEGNLCQLSAHLKRLQKSAAALGFMGIPSSDAIKSEIERTLRANTMYDGVHVRVTLSRGVKTTSSMNPKFNVMGCTLIVVPEFKEVGGVATYDNTKGVTLITSNTRRNPPQCLDSKIHHCNMLNNILPKIQANAAGAADAVMLDIEGYVAETNATNLFAVEDNVLITPEATHCLPGVTRAAVIKLAKEAGIEVEVRRVSLAELHSADEVFTTGSMGELTPVVMIDGRIIGTGSRGPMTAQLQDLYRAFAKGN